MFERRGLVRVVEPRRLDAGVLKAEVETAIEENGAVGHPQGAVDVDGAQRAAHHLLQVAADAATARKAAKGARR
jgi:hypothetical protein